MDEAVGYLLELRIPGRLCWIILVSHAIFMESVHNVVHIIGQMIG